jgi:hypothetical protein
MPYTITIELRVDHDTQNCKVKDPIVLKFCQQMARELLTKATMVQDRRAPQIMVTDGDFFSETKDVAIFGDDDPQ